MAFGSCSQAALAAAPVGRGGAGAPTALAVGPATRCTSDATSRTRSQRRIRRSSRTQGTANCSRRPVAWTACTTTTTSGRTTRGRRYPHPAREPGGIPRLHRRVCGLSAPRAPRASSQPHTFGAAPHQIKARPPTPPPSPRQPNPRRPITSWTARALTPRGAAQVIVLDTRTHRADFPVPSVANAVPLGALLAAAVRGATVAAGLGRAYAGDVLGEEQWAWLEAQLNGTCRGGSRSWSRAFRSPSNQIKSNPVAPPHGPLLASRRTGFFSPPVGLCRVGRWQGEPWGRW